MKRLSLLFPFVVLVLLVLGVIWFRGQTEAPSVDSSLKDFLITRGSSAAQIANKLEKEGFIKNSLAFRIYIQVTGLSKKIPAGEYSLSKSFSLYRLVEELLRGPTEIWVTIPEGLRKEEVAQRFALAFGKNEEFIKEFLANPQAQEGYLFPDTYLFPKTASPEAVVSKMRSTFEVRTKEVQGKISNQELSLAEIVTLASIVERESRLDEERPIIAGILLNRLDIGMGLQADATVQYATGSVKCRGRSDCEWWTLLTREDLTINSPYNTYRFRGLPPGPIASPGLSSIAAALEPTKTDYLYYLHDAKGVAHYARTLEEHNENVRLYLGK